jgi:hypothetical protein
VPLAVGHVGGNGIARREALLDRLVLGVGIGQVTLERHPERRLGLGQRDPVLRPLRPGDARHDIREVKLEPITERRLVGVLVVPEPLLLGVGLDQLDQLRRSTREFEIAERLRVDWEDRAGRAELG